MQEQNRADRVFAPAPYSSGGRVPARRGKRNARRRLGFAAPRESGNLPHHRLTREGGILPLPPNERLALDIPARGA